jgi:carbamate kinase
MAMRIVVGLGGNALLKRGEPMTAEQQRINVRHAAKSLAGTDRSGPSDHPALG